MNEPQHNGLTCDICKKSGFKSPQALGAHKRFNHPGESKGAIAKAKAKGNGRRKKGKKTRFVMTEGEVPPFSLCPECVKRLTLNALLMAAKQIT